VTKPPTSSDRLCHLKFRIRLPRNRSITSIFGKFVKNLFSARLAWEAVETRVCVCSTYICDVITHLLTFLGDARLKFRNFDLSYLGEPNSTWEGRTRYSSSAR